jgi:hypothetical protein
MHYIPQQTNDRARTHLERLANLLIVHAEADHGPVDASLGPLNPIVLPFASERSFSFQLALKLAHADEDRLVIQHLAAAGYHLRFYAARSESPEARWHVLKLMAGYGAFQSSLPLTETHCETPDGVADLGLPSVTALALTASLVRNVAIAAKR